MARKPVSCWLQIAPSGQEEKQKIWPAGTVSYIDQKIIVNRSLMNQTFTVAKNIFHPEMLINTSLLGPFYNIYDISMFAIFLYRWTTERRRIHSPLSSISPDVLEICTGKVEET
jgi:hypothetical protein